MGDENKLKQALDNLLDNAKKATLNGGTVSVTMRRREQQVCVDVVDTGIGIPKAEIARIFGYYYRASNRTGGGSGIGLAITWRIVHRHRGEITVRSELGQGSTFTICLPRADYQPPAPTFWRRLAGWWAELTG
ncbi:MAG: ATP-binding protein, partial [Deinococcus sp.]|nr:ATP-binding protein [Deinococcus sp.]